MSEPHPGAIAGISSEQFAETARAIGEAVGSTADEAIRERPAWLVPDRFTFMPDPERPGFTIDSEGSES